MKTRTIITVIGLAALLAGSARADQDQLAQSIRDARIETSRTHTQLEATMKAVNALANQKEGDLRPAYKTFCAEVANTQSAAVWTKSRIQWMAGDGRHYFQDWQGTVNGITDNSSKKKAQKRLDAAKSSYTKVETSLQEAAEKFRPLLSNLADIQRILAPDVTAGGVEAIKGTVRSANSDNKSVDKAIKSALKEMDKMEKSLSSQAK